MPGPHTILMPQSKDEWRYCIRLAENILATLDQIIEMQQRMIEQFDRMLGDQPVFEAKIEEL